MCGNFAVVLLERRESERRDKHAHPDPGFAAASAAAQPDLIVSIFKRSVQLEGQVSVLTDYLFFFKNNDRKVFPHDKLR